ncbi:DUF5684 domain-containing protein [Chloroflexota bacterium]
MVCKLGNTEEAIMPPITSLFVGTYSIGWLAVYFWLALCLHMIANKTKTQNAWLAWIPIVNIYLMCKIAGRSGWWTILFFIPLLNVVILVVIWMGIAQARNRDSLLGILMIIPFVNLIIPGVLAFSE